MARIVEICGSPGAGKSSIFDELEKKGKRKGNRLWSTSSDKDPYGHNSYPAFANRILLKIKKGKRNVGRSEKKESLYLFAKRIYREIKLGRHFIDQERLKEAGARFIAQNPLYMDAVWKNIFYTQAESSNGLDLRFEKADWMYRVIKKIQVIKEKDSQQFFIIDEGLVNMIDRAMYKSSSVLEEQEEIQELLKIIPLPDALVYIETELEENVKRLIYRKEIRSMHLNMAKEDLMIITQTCRERILNSIKYLEKGGLPILYLDSTDSLEINALKIVAFTEKLAASSDEPANSATEINWSGRGKEGNHLHQFEQSHQI